MRIETPRNVCTANMMYTHFMCGFAFTLETKAPKAIFMKLKLFKRSAHSARPHPREAGVRCMDPCCFAPWLPCSCALSRFMSCSTAMFLFRSLAFLLFRYLAALLSCTLARLLSCTHAPYFPAFLLSCFHSSRKLRGLSSSFVKSLTSTLPDVDLLMF